jgi:hypothetical protein
LAEFPSAIEAVRAATQFQTRIDERTIGDAEDKRIAFRVGINIGDVIHSQSRVGLAGTLPRLIPVKERLSATPIRLRVGDQWPSCRCPAEKHDELAPLHMLTSEQASRSAPT